MMVPLFVSLAIYLLLWIERGSKRALRGPRDLALFAIKVAQRDTFLGNPIELFSPPYKPHQLFSLLTHGSGLYFFPIFSR